MMLEACLRNTDYRVIDQSLARSGRKKLMFLSEWREFPSAPCLVEKKNMPYLGCVGWVGYNIYKFQRMWTEVIVAYWKFNPIRILNRLTLK